MPKIAPFDRDKILFLHQQGDSQGSARSKRGISWAYINMVCTVYKKKTEETGQMGNKSISASHLKISTEMSNI